MGVYICIYIYIYICMYTTFGPKGKSHPPIPSNIIIAMNILPPEIGTVNNDPNANAIRAMCKCECMRVPC